MEEIDLDALVDKFIDRIANNPDAVAEYMETLEERIDEWRESKDRFVPAAQAVDPTLTVKPTELKRKPQTYHDEESLGMVIAKSHSSIGAARDWVNSVEGYHSPFCNDEGLLVLKSKPNGGDSGFWIAAGEVLTYGTYGFSSTWSGAYELEGYDEESEEDSAQPVQQ